MHLFFQIFSFSWFWKNQTFYQKQSPQKHNILKLSISIIRHTFCFHNPLFCILIFAWLAQGKAPSHGKYRIGAELNPQGIDQERSTSKGGYG
jgi:hypothetical protein